MKSIHDKLQQEGLIEYNNTPFDREAYPSMTTGWLAGTIDSDGCLGVTRRKNRKSPRFRIMIDQNDRSMLEKIKECISEIHPDKGTIHKRKGQDGHRLTYQSRGLIQEVFFPYFKRHPLRTNKKYGLITFRKILHKNITLKMSQAELSHDINVFLF